MRINKSLITYIPTTGAGSGTVTSVALSAPTGFTVSGSPITSSGTLTLAFTTGYGIPPLMTGNSGRFLTTNGTTMSWANIAGTDVTGAALTEVDDTNVTMTLGGTPATALLRSVSMTLGWTGTLSAGRGGTGTSGVSGIMLGNSTAPVTGITGIGGQLLRANPSTGVYEFFTPTYMSNPMTTLGDIIYGNAAGAPTRLAANSTANNMYLRSVSSGIPVWGSIAGADITGAAITKTDDTNVTLTLGGTPANSVLRSVSFTLGWTGALSPSRGGTGSTSITGVVIGSGIGTMVGVAGTADQLLRRNSANTAYEFFTPTFLSNPMTSLGDIIYGNAAGAPLRLGANATSTNKYLRSVNGNPPTWEQIAAADVSGAVSGSGTTNYVSKWTSSTALGNSLIFDNGTNVGVNTQVPEAQLHVYKAADASFFLGQTGSSAKQSLFIHYTSGNGYLSIQSVYQNNSYTDIYLNPSGGNVAIGKFSSVSKLDVAGSVNISSASYLTWGGAYGTDIPSITGTSGTGSFIDLHPAGSTSGARMRLASTGQLRLHGYTSTSSFSGLTVGLLGFTSTGSITTYSIPGGVSGTQNYLAKFDSTGVAVTDSRFIDNGTNFLLNGASSYITGFNLIGDIGIQSASGQASAIIQRSNQTPTSGTAIAFLDAYAITTGSTYQMGGAIEFRASQNWNSTSAGTNIFVQTALDNTVAPADMFVFLNNGAVRFIGRTSNPLSPAAGTMYYNSSANNMRYYNGTTWITF